MNHIHRIVWNACRGAWVVTHEGASTRGKSSTTTKAGRASSRLLSVALGGAMATGAWAQAIPAPNTLPTAGQVTAGSATLQQSGATLQIDQSSQRAAIQWGTFNVGSAAKVNFNQPNAQAVTLNRVLDSNASQIHGNITANGQVWLLNPNGVLFGKTASVDVGGLVATTHSMTDAAFMAGGSSFTEPGKSAAVVNQGSLQVKLGGYIALLAPEVRNEGVVVVPLGTAVLASGNTITLHLNGTGLAGIDVTPSQLNALVENKNAVIAEEGTVIFSARAVDGLLSGVVRNSGTVAATGITQKGGRILLEASTQTMVSGNSLLDASSAVNKGGDITLTAPDVAVLDNSRISATGAGGGGTIHVGGEWQGGGVTPQSKAVYLGANTLLDASATGFGNGGEVVAWSDIHNPIGATRAYGTLLANAGTYGGDGGRIETSGYFLDVAGGYASAAAPKGTAGEWLLDPFNITIAAAGASGTPYAATYTSAADSVILASSINASLNAGTNVTLTTGAGGASAGDINVNANIAKTAGGNANLTLRAHNAIIMATNVGISSTVGQLNVLFNSDFDASNVGGIVMNTGSSISTNGGSITFGGGSAGTGASWAVGDGVNSFSGIGLVGATLNAGGGNIVMRGLGYFGGSSAGAQRGVRLLSGTAVSTTGAGTIAITGFGGSNTNVTVDENAGILVEGASTITGGSTGTVTLTGNGGAANGDYNAGVLIRDANTRVTSTGGSITVTGTGGGAGTSAGGEVGIRVSAGATLQPGANGSLTMTGTGSSAGSNDNANHGVYITGANTLVGTLGTAAATITGQGGGAGTSGSNFGIIVDDTATVQTGGLLTMQGIGGAGTGDSHYGIGLQTGAQVVGGGGATLTGTAGGSSGQANHGILVSGASLTALGTSNLNLTGTGGTSTGIGNAGVFVTGAGGAVAANGGNVTIVGQGGGSGASSSNLGVTIGSGGGTVSTTGSGTVSITGIGGVGASSFGVILGAAGAVSVANTSATFTTDSMAIDPAASINAGTGTVTIRNRTAGTLINLGGADVLTGSPLTLGLTDAELDRITAGTLVIGRTGATASGDVTLSASISPALATNLTVLGGSNIVLNANQGITTLTNGSVILNADADGSNSGAIVMNTGSSINSNGGNITLGGGSAGTGAGSAVGDGVASFSGIALLGATLNASGGNVAMRGLGYQGGGSAGGQRGVRLSTGSAVSTTGAGNIAITGVGGANTTGTTIENIGILVETASTITGGSTGALTLTGTGGAAQGDGNAGVMVRDANTRVTTTGGNISVTGVGNGAGTSSGGDIGIEVSAGATLQTAGAGTLTMSGTGGGTTGDNSNFGVNITGANTLVGTQGSAAATITGQGGGAGTSASNIGIVVDSSAAVQAGGLLTMQGTGGAAIGSNQSGIYIATAGQVSGGGGTTLTSLGGGAGLTGGADVGVVVLGGTVTAGGTSAVSVTGTGGTSTGDNNYGVSVTASGAITSGGGNVNVVGQGGGSGASTGNQGVTAFGSGVISATGSGTVGITGAAGVGATSYGVNLGATGSVTTANSATTITADTVNIDTSGTPASINAGTGTVTIRNRTAGTLVNIGGADVLTGSPLTLGLTDAELDRITAGTLVVGRNDGTAAGALTVSAASTPALATNFTLVNGAAMTLNAALGANNTLTLTAGTAASVTQAVGANITATNLLLNGPSAGYALATATANNVATLAATGVGAVAYRDTNALQIGTVGAVNGVSASGVVDIGTLAGDLTVAQSVSTTNATTSALRLNAGVSAAAGTGTGGELIIAGGGGSTGAGGRATLMTGTVAGSTGLTTLVGSGSGRFRYNSDEVATNYSTALGTGLYAIYREQPTVTVTANNASKTYDAAAFSGGNGVTFSGNANGDANSVFTGTVAYGGTSQGAVNAGSYAISASGLANGLGYAISYADGTLTVNQANLVLSGSQVYNGTTSMAGANLTATGVAGQTFALTGNGTLGSKDVQTNQALASVAGLTLGASGNGGLASNYNAISTTGSSVSVTPAALALSGTRAYNGTTAMAGSTLTATGVAGETFALSGSGTLSSKNVQSNQLLASVAGLTLGSSGNGGLASNYSAISTTGSSASVTAAALTVSTADVVKTYNGSTAAPGASATVTSGTLFGSDSLSGGSFAYTDKNVGIGNKTVTVAGVTVSDGNSGGNYTLTLANNTTSTINPATLSLTGTQVYNGGTSMASGNLTATGVAGETFALTGSGTLASKNVQTNQNLASVAGLTLGASGNGGVASNYNALSAAASSVSVTPAAISATTADVVKTYDGNTTAPGASAVVASGSLFGSDALSGGSFAYADKNAGSGNKLVTVAGVTVNDGNGGANYSITQVNNTTSTINKADLAVVGGACTTALL